MLVKFLILIILIFIKSIFSAADTAFTYLNKAKFHQLSKNAKRKNSKKIKKINNMLNSKLKLFSVTKLGMTLAELFVSVFAAEAFVRMLAESIEILNNANIQYVVAIIIVTCVLSYLTLVFGELIPKRIARNNPEKIAYKTINILLVFSKISYFFEKLLNASENLFSRIFGIKNEPSEKLTEREIKLIIAEGKDQGLIDIEEKKLLYNALKFDDLKVKNIMIPKEKMISININDSKEKIFNTIKKYKYTRIPVYSKNKDNIIGIINVKSILLELIDNKNEFNINNLKKDAFFVTKEEKIDDVFYNMQLNNKHMAIVKKKDGEIEGFLTLEDIIEKLLGAIIDEFDENK